MEYHISSKEQNPLDSNNSSVESMPKELPIKNEDLDAETNVVEDTDLTGGSIPKNATASREDFAAEAHACGSAVSFNHEPWFEGDCDCAAILASYADLESGSESECEFKDEKPVEGDEMPVEEDEKPVEGDEKPVEEMEIREPERNGFRSPGSIIEERYQSAVRYIASLGIPARIFEERDAVTMAYLNQMMHACNNHRVPNTPHPRFGRVREENREAYEFCQNHLIDYLIEFQDLKEKASEQGNVLNLAFFKKFAGIARKILIFREARACFIE